MSDAHHQGGPAAPPSSPILSAFLPGLVIGLIIGGLLGVFVASRGGASLPQRSDAPGVRAGGTAHADDSAPPAEGEDPAAVEKDGTADPAATSPSQAPAPEGSAPGATQPPKP